MGSGALQKLAANDTFPLNLDALLLSHAHLDHVADVIPLLFALNVPGYDRATPLDIYASAETIAILDRVRAAWGDWLNVDPASARFHAVAAGATFTIGDRFDVEVGTVEHTDSSVGYRIIAPSGAVLALPGDSGPCEGLTALCRDADLAVVECAMPDVFPIEGHMTPSTLAALVRESELRHLVAVHQYPAATACNAIGTLRDAIDVPLSVPDDGTTFALVPT